MKFLILFSLVLSSVYAADSKVSKPKYRSGKRIDFESLLIEGEKRKADYAVVTGNLGEEDFGLIKLREDFLDLMANDTQEEVE
ncbi:MAG: hypothetical protein VYA54_00920 [Bdellovibrionota bacterium]|nr:hypothetical protein [Bdellovibrionota bacterium]